MTKTFVFFAALAIAALTGCTSEFRSVPAGYIGKILTPSGFATNILEAGQVDLKVKGDAGQQNTLVLLEATSVSIKEVFEKTNERDNRISIGGIPVTVDVYVRMRVPTDDKTRHGIFSQITPVAVSDDKRVSSISVDAVYSRLAKMDVRSVIRQVLSKYNHIDSVTKNQERVNNELGAKALEQFSRTSVPLELQNVVISNVQPDPTILEAENSNKAAMSEVERIRAIGEAIRENPQYLQSKKYDTYRDIANKGATIYIIDGNAPITIPTR